MKTFTRFVLAPLNLCLLFVFSCGAQSLPSSADRFVSGEGGFTIDLPVQPTVRDKINFTILSYDASGESIAWRDTPEFFATVENYRVSGGADFKLSPAEKASALKAHKKNFTDALAEAGIKYDEVPFVFQKENGYEIRASSPTARMVSRGFFVKSRLIILSVNKKFVENFDFQLKLINSFRLLTKAERAAALIAENTPKELPQTPAVARPLTDARENNLKGKVKTVIEESQDSPKAAREFYSEDDYDESGNLIKQISFFEGYPDEVTAWGWIDGARVSRGESIEYALDEGPNENGVKRIIGIAAGDNNAAPKKRDERFGSRYEYKYDDKNRVIEKKTFSNDGDLSFSQTISYAQNRRDTTTRGSNGEFRIRFVETLDASGNVIEEQYFDEKNKADEEPTVYRYELDARGNWTVQKSFERKTVKGKKVLTPQSVHFRKITYYD